MAIAGSPRSAATAPEALVGLAHPLGVAVHLGLAQHAPQQLLGLVELALADHHRRVQQLERPRALLRRGLARELLGAHAEAAGDLHEHARAGAAVAGLDAGQVAVGAPVERELPLGQALLAAQVANAGAELAQRLVRVLVVVPWVFFHGRLPHRSVNIAPLPVHSWQDYTFAVAGTRPAIHCRPWPSRSPVMRRLRRTAGVRDLVRETARFAGRPDPAAVRAARRRARRRSPSMPGQYHLSVDSLVERAAAARTPPAFPR